MAAIHFLNPAPLMWDFEHMSPSAAPCVSAIRSVTPRLRAVLRSWPLARLISAGFLVAAHALTPSLSVVPGCTVAALDRVRSMIFVVRAQQGVNGVRTIAADTSSLTSCAYTRILSQIFWKVPAAFIHQPRLESMLSLSPTRRC